MKPKEILKELKERINIGKQYDTISGGTTNDLMEVVERLEKELLDQPKIKNKTKECKSCGKAFTSNNPVKHNCDKCSYHPSKQNIMKEQQQIKELLSQIEDEIKLIYKNNTTYEVLINYSHTVLELKSKAYVLKWVLESN